MNKQPGRDFQLLKRTRQNIAGYASGFSLEELNHIPAGFNNNIIWNMGHLLATQEILIYKFSGLDFTTSEDFINRYRKATKPEGLVENEEAEFIRNALTRSVEVLAEKYQQNAFGEYRKYETSFGVVLESVEDATAFVTVHDAMHFGFIKAIGKLVKKNGS